MHQKTFVRQQRTSSPNIPKAISFGFTWTTVGIHKASWDAARCAHDTRLEPTHVLIDCSPVDGRPVDCSWGTAPACVSAAVIRFVLDVGSSGSLVGKDRMEVCPLFSVLFFVVNAL